VPVGGPQLQFGVATRVEPDREAGLRVPDGEAPHDLRVAAVEAFGQAHERRQYRHRLPLSPSEVLELAVRAPGRGPAMVAGDEANHLDLVRLEAAQASVPDEVPRVLVVPLVADVVSDVVQERRVFEPLALAGAEAVVQPGGIEQPEGEPCDLSGVGRVVRAAFRQLDHAAPPDIRVALRRPDMRRIPTDVVEHQTLTQGVVAQGQVVSAQALDERVDENRPDSGQIGAPRVESRQLQPLGDRQRREPAAQPGQRSGRHAQVPNVVSRSITAGRECTQ